MAALRDSEFCWAHDPTRSRERAAARKLGGQRRKRPKTAAPDVVSLRDVPSILTLIERVMTDTLILENGVARSRAVAYLAAQAMKALEVGEMNERLSAIEALLTGNSNRSDWIE